MLSNILNIINIILVFQLSLFCLAIILSESKNFSWKPLLFFVVTNAILVSFSLFNSYEILSVYEYPVLVYFLSSIHLLLGPLLYSYTKNLKSSSNNVTKNSLQHLILPFLIFLFLVIDFYTRSEFSNSTAEKISIFTKYTYYTFSIVYGIQLFYYILRSFSTIKSYENQLEGIYSNTEKISLRWLNILLYIYLIHWFTENITPILYFLEIGNETIYTATAIISMLSLLLFTSSVALKSMINTNNQIIFDEKPKYYNSVLSEEKSLESLNAILKFMENSKPYLNPDLKIGDMAEETGISEKIISQVINQHLNKHFFDFVNSYRINEAKKLLTNTQINQRKTSILEIIFDSGFNSKSAFNRAFKKHSGKTPSQFKSSINHEYTMVPD